MSSRRRSKREETKQEQCAMRALQHLDDDLAQQERIEGLVSHLRGKSHAVAAFREEPVGGMFDRMKEGAKKLRGLNSSYLRKNELDSNARRDTLKTKTAKITKLQTALENLRKKKVAAPRRDTATAQSYAAFMVGRTALARAISVLNNAVIDGGAYHKEFADYKAKSSDFITRDSRKDDSALEETNAKLARKNKPSGPKKSDATKAIAARASATAAHTLLGENLKDATEVVADSINDLFK
jgi:hypothetical protein